MRRRVRVRVPVVAATALLATALALAATAAASSRGAARNPAPSEGAALSESEVLAAQRAWNKLRDGLEHGEVHGARRREVESAAVDGGDEPQEAAAVVVLRSGPSVGGEPRALLTEYTVDAESSFTAVSKALDALANQTRRAAATGKSSGHAGGRGSGERPAIAKNVYIVEGSVDPDTIKGYLNSKRASDALAHTEANALRKVMSMLLQPDATGSISHTRIGRSVDRIAQHSLAKRSIPQYNAQNHITTHHHRRARDHKKNRSDIGNKVRAFGKSIAKRSWNRHRNERDARKPHKADDEDEDDDEDKDETEDEKTAKKGSKGSRMMSNIYDYDEDGDIAPRFFVDFSKDSSEVERTETRLGGGRGDYRTSQNKDSRLPNKELSLDALRRHEEQYARDEAARKARYREEDSEEEEDQSANTGKQGSVKGNTRGRAGVKEESHEISSKEYGVGDKRSETRKKGKTGKSEEEEDDDDY